MTTSPPRYESRFHGLDTLRAVAIGLVMLYHLGIRGLLPGALDSVAAVGWVGVDLFFVLSGFLIGTQLLKPYRAGTTPSLRGFYLRRAYRILPAYLVVLGLYFAVPAWREAKGPYAVWQYLSFTWNLLLRGYPEGRAFSHVWSLCVEEHFYLVLPLLLAAMMRRPSPRRIGALLAAIVLGGVALRWMLLREVVLTAPDDLSGVAFMRYIYYPTYSRLDGLTVGVGLALVRGFRPLWWAKVAPHGNVCFMGGVVVVAWALWLCGFGFPDPNVTASVLFAFPMLAIGSGLLVASAVCDRGLMRVRVPGAAAVAALAYSLYLTHKSVAQGLHQMFPALTAEGQWRALGVYAVGCGVVAALLYFGVERPFLRLRSGRKGEVGRAAVEDEVRLDPAL